MRNSSSTIGTGWPLDTLSARCTGIALVALVALRAGGTRCTVCAWTARKPGIALHPLGTGTTVHAWGSWWPWDGRISSWWTLGAWIALRPYSARFSVRSWRPWQTGTGGQLDDNLCRRDHLDDERPHLDTSGWTVNLVRLR